MFASVICDKETTID